MNKITLLLAVSVFCFCGEHLLAMQEDSSSNAPTAKPKAPPTKLQKAAAYLKEQGYKRFDDEPYEMFVKIYREILGRECPLTKEQYAEKQRLIALRDKEVERVTPIIRQEEKVIADQDIYIYFEGRTALPDKITLDHVKKSLFLKEFLQREPTLKEVFDPTSPEAG